MNFFLYLCAWIYVEGCLSGWVNRHIDVYYTTFLACMNLANSNSWSESCSGRCSTDVLYPYILLRLNILCLICKGCTILTYRRRLQRCSFYHEGNARAYTRRTSNRDEVLRFFYVKKLFVYVFCINFFAGFNWGISRKSFKRVGIMYKLFLLWKN